MAISRYTSHTLESQYATTAREALEWDYQDLVNHLASYEKDVAHARAALAHAEQQLAERRALLSGIMTEICERLNPR